MTPASLLLSLALSFAAAAPDRAAAPVILISVDTLRADRVRDDLMPHLSALRREGIDFSAAYSQATWTLPSHASLFFSQYPRALDVGSIRRMSLGMNFKAPRPAPRLTDVLIADGYEGVSFAEVPFFNPAFRLQHERVREHLFQTPAPHFDDALAALPRGSTAAYVFIHTYLVHHYKNIVEAPHKDAAGAWRCPAAYAPFQMEREQEFINGGNDSISCEELAARYDRAAACFDAQLGAFIAGLKKNGVWDRALVAVVADHGESLCDGAAGKPRHGHGGHGREELLHVPWLLKLPDGRLAGRRVESPVELVDVAPTILAALGLERPASFVGRDRLPLASGAPLEDASPVYAEDEHWSSVAEGRWRLVRVKGAGEKLFDLARDPEETTDASARAPARLKRLRAYLRKHDKASAGLGYAADEEGHSRIVPTRSLTDSLRRAGYLP